MRQICLVSLVLTAICLGSTGSVLAQAPSGIQIYLPNGGMPSRVMTITLIREDGFTDTVFTDSKGKFQIRTPANQSARYTAIIEGDKQSYDTTTTTFTLSRNQPNYVTIFLKPLTAENLPQNAVLDVATFEGNVPPVARAAYREASDAISKEQFEEAISGLQKAIRLYPKYVRALNDLGVIFLRFNRLDEAAAAFRQAVNISKRFFHSRINLGIVLNRQQKYKEAVEILGPLYDENHGILDVRLAYANALMGNDEIAKAAELFWSVLESPNLPDLTRANTHFRLGVILNRQGKFAEAVAELEKAIALNPNATNAHLQLGAALMQLKELPRAESELLRAYEIGGASAGGAQFLLGHIYYTQQRFRDAQRAFEQYLKDLPSAPNASQILEVIAKLKATSKN